MLDNADGTISCERCCASWRTDDGGYRWYDDYRSRAQGLQDYPSVVEGDPGYEELPADPHPPQEDLPLDGDRLHVSHIGEGQEYGKIRIDSKEQGHCPICGIGKLKGY